MNFRGFLLTPIPTWWGLISLMHILHVRIPQGTSFTKVSPVSIFETVLEFISLLKVSSPCWNSLSHLKKMHSNETAAVVPIGSPQSRLTVSITLPVLAWLGVGKQRVDTKAKMAKKSWDHRMLGVGRELKDHLDPLDQVAQGLTQPCLEHCQNWGNLPGQPVQCLTTLTVKTFFLRKPFPPAHCFKKGPKLTWMEHFPLFLLAQVKSFSMIHCQPCQLP